MQNIQSLQHPGLVVVTHKIRRLHRWMIYRHCVVRLHFPLILCFSFDVEALRHHVYQLSGVRFTCNLIGQAHDNFLWFIVLRCQWRAHWFSIFWVSRHSKVNTEQILVMKFLYL